MPVVALKSIVVAIADPFSRKQMALHKAAAIARRCNAKLTLLHTFSLPYPFPDPASVISTKELIEHVRTTQLQQLQKLARSLARSGLHIECEVIWDFPVHGAIVRFVNKRKPDLLIAASHRHGKLSRWLLSNADWELIRSCPCPLWFVKAQRLPVRLNLLAAVDPLHVHAKPATLDKRILSFARIIKRSVGGDINMCHAYSLIPDQTSGHISQPSSIRTDSQHMRTHAAKVKTIFAKLALRYAVPTRHRYFEAGDAVDIIPQVARNIRAHAVIMGAVSRSAKGRVYVGNTAERVIDMVDCDVVVVKPAGFKTSIKARAAKLKI